MISRDFALVVGAAAVIAAPIAFVMMRGWLGHFAYRIEMGPSVFFFGSVTALAIAQATVTFHSLRVARTDPVDVLRE